MAPKLQSMWMVRPVVSLAAVVAVSVVGAGAANSAVAVFEALPPVGCNA